MNSSDEVAYIKRLFPRLGDIGAASIARHSHQPASGSVIVTTILYTPET